MPPPPPPPTPRAQDYPRALGADSRVGFTAISGHTVFSPCKNSLAEAAQQVRAVRESR
jgi:hypothetical protein